MASDRTVPNDALGYVEPDQENDDVSSEDVSGEDADSANDADENGS
jgi:hypothetical protein